jgi:hypothetical protein
VSVPARILLVRGIVGLNLVVQENKVNSYKALYGLARLFRALYEACLFGSKN